MNVQKEAVEKRKRDAQKRLNDGTSGNPWLQFRDRQYASGNFNMKDISRLYKQRQERTVSDSWVTDPAWEREAIVVTKAAEQHYFKCLKNNVKVEDCDDSSLADTLSFDSISPPCLDCSSGESTFDDGETTADEGVAGLQQGTEASSNIAEQQRLAPAAVANERVPVREAQLRLAVSGSAII